MTPGRVVIAALVDRPGDPAAYARLAQDQANHGDLASAAVAAFRAALLVPSDQGTWTAAGNWAAASGIWSLALYAFARATGLWPGEPAFALPLAMTLDCNGHNARALAWFRRAVSLSPDAIAPRRALVTQLYAFSRTEEIDLVAAEGARRTGDPLLRLKAAMAMPMVPRSSAEITARRARLAETLTVLTEARVQIDQPVATVAMTNFALTYHAQDDRPLQEATARLFRQAAPVLNHVAECRGSGRPGGRIRLGFVTEFAGDHTIGRLAHRLIAGLPAEQFEKVLIATPGAEDPVRARLLAGVERYQPLWADLARSQRDIGALGCDVLLYLDIGMSAVTYFLAFARLAPAQAATWGHPDTTGLSTIDAFLSCAAMEPAGAAQHYTERLLALDGTNFHCRPDDDAPPPKTRADFGLPSEGRIYLCPQTRFKFHPDFDAVLLELLDRDGSGWLVLTAGTQGELDRRFLDRLAARVPGITRRVLIMPRLSRRDFVALAGLADAVLDIPQYSGGFSTLEMFQVGAPVVTLPGAFMRGRHTLGFYRLMGMDDLIAANPAGYLELVLALARDPDRRATVGRRIIERRHLAWDHPRTVPAMAEALAALAGAR